MVMMRSANTRWRILYLVFVVVAAGLLAVAATNEAEGECSANDESCAADNDIEPAEELTQCKDTHDECKYWASVGEVSRYCFSCGPSSPVRLLI